LFFQRKKILLGSKLVYFDSIGAGLRGQTGQQLGAIKWRQAAIIKAVHRLEKLPAPPFFDAAQYKNYYGKRN